MRSDSTFVTRSRRQQIVDGAIEVLAEQGYPGTSLNTIAARVGVSKGVLSYHFEGKEALLRAVVATVLSDATTFMTPRLIESRSHTAALTAYVEANLEFLATHAVAVRALTEILNNSRPADTGFPAQRNEAVAGLVDMLRRGQAAGEFGEFDPLVVASSLRASIDAVAGAVIDVPRYAGELIRLFLHGVAA